MKGVMIKGLVWFFYETNIFVITFLFLKFSHGSTISFSSKFTRGIVCCWSLEQGKNPGNIFRICNITFMQAISATLVKSQCYVCNDKESLSLWYWNTYFFSPINAFHTGTLCNTAVSGGRQMNHLDTSTLLQHLNQMHL